MLKKHITASTRITAKPHHLPLLFEQCLFDITYSLGRLDLDRDGLAGERFDEDLHDGCWKMQFEGGTMSVSLRGCVSTRDRVSTIGQDSSYF